MSQRTTAVITAPIFLLRLGACSTLANKRRQREAISARILLRSLLLVSVPSASRAPASQILLKPTRFTRTPSTTPMPASATDSDNTGNSNPLVPWSFGMSMIRSKEGKDTVPILLLVWADELGSPASADDDTTANVRAVVSLVSTQTHGCGRILPSCWAMSLARNDV